MKPEIFNPKTKRNEQATSEANMLSSDRLLLTLELINLSIAFSQEKTLRQHSDNFNWIDLKTKYE
jgi:hypothetical protein